MPAALPPTAAGHPALGAVIYLVIIMALVGFSVVAAHRGSSRGGDQNRGRNRRRPPRR
ncbi:hypothetical protein ABIA35_004935 [Catenulispora sp. MAP12-49]|uniref:hypothetical protein n=1 Tax=Catenulispora sp. MAP12-49 TaxID=3156302 RepID=UPI00351797CD